MNSLIPSFSSKFSISDAKKRDIRVDPGKHNKDVIASNEYTSPTIQSREDFGRNYTITDQLGVGGYGHIYSAVRKSDGVVVAVKFLRRDKVLPSKWTMDKDLGLIPLEIYVLKNVQHKGVVEFIELYRDNTYFIVVQEQFGAAWTTTLAKEASNGPKLTQKVRKMRCMDLYELLDSRIVPERDIKNMYRQIVEAVTFLYNTHLVIHGDLKDENILVSADYKIKLIDFGGAVKVHPKERTVASQQFHGTLEFAPPEIINHQRYDAEKAEVWSLGVLLFSMMYNSLPFPYIEQIVQVDFKDTIAYKQYQKTQAMDLVAKCLQKDPEQRPSFEQILEHPWLS